LISGRYEPAFKLPDHDYWIDVAPVEINDQIIERALDIARRSGTELCVLSPNLEPAPEGFPLGGVICFPNGRYEGGYWWAVDTVSQEITMAQRNTPNAEFNHEILRQACRLGNRPIFVTENRPRPHQPTPLTTSSHLIPMLVNADRLCQELLGTEWRLRPDRHGDIDVDGILTILASCKTDAVAAYLLGVIRHMDIMYRREDSFPYMTAVSVNNEEFWGEGVDFSGPWVGWYLDELKGWSGPSALTVVAHCTFKDGSTRDLAVFTGEERSELGTFYYGGLNMDTTESLPSPTSWLKALILKDREADIRDNLPDGYDLLVDVAEYPLYEHDPTLPF